jgi:DNA (cytosine-5)-methyltransferase 1
LIFNPRKTKGIILEQMKIIDLFSGCGGLSLGFQNAGYEIIAACDYWEAAVNVYKYNFKHQIYLWDK